MYRGASGDGRQRSWTGYHSSSTQACSRPWGHLGRPVHCGGGHTGQTKHPGLPPPPRLSPPPPGPSTIIPFPLAMGEELAAAHTANARGCAHAPHHTAGVLNAVCQARSQIRHRRRCGLGRCTARRLERRRRARRLGHCTLLLGRRRGAVVSLALVPALVGQVPFHVSLRQRQAVRPSLHERRRHPGAGQLRRGDRGRGRRSRAGQSTNWHGRRRRRDRLKLAWIRAWACMRSPAPSNKRQRQV